MNDLLSKAKELNEKRTQGAWVIGPHPLSDDPPTDCDATYCLSIGDQRTDAGYSINDTRYYPSAPRKNDAEFIAFAPEFFDWAIKEIERLSELDPYEELQRKFEKLRDRALDLTTILKTTSLGRPEWDKIFKAVKGIDDAT